MIRIPRNDKPPLGVGVNSSNWVKNKISYAQFCNEGAGLVTYDGVGNNNSSIVVSEWTIDDYGEKVLTTASGSNTGIYCDKILGATTTPFTIFVRAEALVNAQGYLIAQWASNGIFIQNNGSWGLSVFLNGSQIIIEANFWQNLGRANLALVFDGDQYHVWCNGTLAVSSSTGLSYPNFTADTQFVWGNRADGGRIWQGNISAGMVWNRALSDSQLVELTTKTWETVSEPRLLNFGSAAVAGGAMSGSSTTSISATAKLEGAGKVLGASSILISPTATLSGDGAILGESTILIDSNGILAGLGFVSGNSSITAIVEGILKGLGSIQGETEISIDATGAIIGIGGGAIAGNSQISIDATAKLEGAGAVEGNSQISIDSTGKLVGLGAMSGKSSIVSTIEAVLRGIGSVLGETTISIEATGAMTGEASGEMSGSSTISIDSTAELDGVGALEGSTTITITATGTLSGGEVELGLPMITKIRNAILYSLRNRIDGPGQAIRYSDAGNVVVDELGYYNKLTRVYDPPRSLEQGSDEYPFINVVDNGRFNETSANVQQDQNQSIWHISTIFSFDCIISDSNDPATAQDKLEADIQKFFGINYYIPDEEGVRTAFNCYYQSGEKFGIQSTKPQVGMTVGLKVWWRQLSTDPTLSK